MVEIKNKKLCESCFAGMEEDIGGRCPHCGFSKEEFEPDPMVLPMGTVLEDKILIGRVMGKGGFGITYLGYDLRMEKTIAVKEYYPNGLSYRSQNGTEVLVTNPDSKDTFEKGTEKFYTEAEMVAQFNGNPNIVGVYDYFRANNTVYLIMEYLNGITLKNYVKKHGKLSDGQALYVMNKVAAALSITHSADVLHRDISPDNIMVCMDGKVKLIDFGAARQIMSEGSSNLTVVMKPGYTPIEQYTKKGKQGPWTDIHALGASIYYALTRKVIDDPYERMENDSEFELNIHEINDELWSIIKKCTMINAADRYGNAIELRKALNGISDTLKAEPITLAEEDVKISAEKVGEVRVSLTEAASQSSVRLLASREAEDIESYSQPAVPENEGYNPEVNIYEKLSEKSEKTKSEKTEKTKGKKAKKTKGKKAEEAEGKKAEEAEGEKAQEAESERAEEAEGEKAQEAEGVRAEEAEGEKAEKKPLNKKAAIGIVIIAGTVILGALAIWLVLWLSGSEPLDTEIVEPLERLVLDDSDLVWSSSQAVSKETLERFGGDVRVTINISPYIDTGSHEHFKHEIWLSYGGFNNIVPATKVENGVYNSTLGYDVYYGQQTFTFIISEEDISHLNPSLSVRGHNVMIGSAVLEKVTDEDYERTVPFDESYPGSWRRYSTYLSKSGLQSFGGNVLAEVKYSFVSSPEGFIKPIGENWNAVAVKAPNMMPDDGEAVFRLDSYNNGTFAFIITEDQINDLTVMGLGFMVHGLNISSVTLNSWPYELPGGTASGGSGGASSGSSGTPEPVVLTDFPNEYEEWYGGIIPMYELLKFGGDVRATFDITTGYFCELPEDNDSSEPGIYLNLLNPTGSEEVDGIAAEDLYGISNPNDDPGIFAIPYGTTEFAAVIPRSEIERLNGDLFISVHDLMVNSVTLEDAEAAAANDEAPGTRAAPTVMDYPDEYVDDWRTAATLLKKDLAAYGKDVKVTLDIESGKNKKSECIPCMKITYGTDMTNAEGMITGKDLRAWKNTDDVIYDCPEGKEIFCFYISQENIDKLPGSGLTVQIANVMIKKATVTPVLSFELNTSYPGNWNHSGNVQISDFSPYFTDDIKVTLELEYVDDQQESFFWLGEGVTGYFRHLVIHDRSNKSIIKNTFNRALSSENENENFYFGGFTSDYSGAGGQPYPFEFILTQEDIENTDTCIQFAGGNCYVRTATFEAYDPAEDKLSENAKKILMGISWQDTQGEGTTNILKEELEGFGGDVRIVLDITGSYYDPDSDGLSDITAYNAADGSPVPLYARNHEAPEVHVYQPEIDWSCGYALGYWSLLPNQIDFVITAQQIRELDGSGLFFYVHNAHVSAAYLEAV